MRESRPMVVTAWRMVGVSRGTRRRPRDQQVALSADLDRSNRPARAEHGRVDLLARLAERDYRAALLNSSWPPTCASRRGLRRMKKVALRPRRPRTAGQERLAGCDLTRRLPIVEQPLFPRRRSRTGYGGASRRPAPAAAPALPPHLRPPRPPPQLGTGPGVTGARDRGTHRGSQEPPPAPQRRPHRLPAASSEVSRSRPSTRRSGFPRLGTDRRIARQLGVSP